MKKLYDMVYTEKYTDKDGQEKKKYTNIGSVLERDDGSLCANLLGSWINFYEPRQRITQEAVNNHNQSRANNSQDDFEDEIPFN
jgi:hypothetical protein